MPYFGKAPTWRVNLDQPCFEITKVSQPHLFTDWMDLLRSLPIGLYLEQPSTWLHTLDPRVKLVWLMTFLLTPLLANTQWRVILVGLLILLTFAAAIPWRVWRQQMGWLLLICLLVLGVTAVMPDGLALRYQPRLPLPAQQFGSSPPSHLSDAPPPSLPQPTAYSYVLLEQGPVTMTRQSLDLGIRLSTWLFTLIFGTNLYLLTTAPEEIATAIEHLLQPLSRWRVPVIELTLTLTLSLRFIPLVLEEVQNLIRAIRTRAINWKKLGIRGAIQIWLMLADRLLENLFLRAEQIASAMTARGFTSPNQHQVQWNQLQMQRRDWIVLGSVGVFWGLRIWFGQQP
jgi:energy-coupling factor transport system permease protein